MRRAPEGAPRRRRAGQERPGGYGAWLSRWRWKNMRDSGVRSSLASGREAQAGALSGHTFAGNTYAAWPAASAGGAHGTGVRKACQQLTGRTPMTQIHPV
ncbi:hypothetical protein GCM10010187_21420 [Actinomadura coerulea]|nr:hypothetical protein GCM10010187_21420 [Actinomadura coerulea]